MKTFLEFFTAMDSQAPDNLGMLTIIFRNDGLKVHEFIDDKSDPYIYIFNPLDDLSFQGVTMYKKGNILAYRAQRYEDSQPYGAAYNIDMQGLYEDLLYKEKDKKKAIEILCKTLCKKMREFFRKTKKAEDDILKSNLMTPTDSDGAGQIIIRNTGTDYSNNIYSTNRN